MSGNETTPMLGNQTPLKLRKYEGRLNDEKFRHHVIAAIGEFLGTTLFLFFGFLSAQIINSKSNELSTDGPSLDQLSFVAAGFGVGAAVNVWLFYRVSGGHLNPAITIGLTLIGAVPVVRAGILVVVQLLSGILAASLAHAVTPGPLNVQTTLGQNTSLLQGLVIEIILTATLVLTVFLLAVEKHRTTPFAPLGIGLVLFLNVLLAAQYSGASFNPARSFGPSIVQLEFVDYHWIYWIGPVLGAVGASVVYKILKFLHYETAVSGQDHDGLNVYRLIDDSDGREVDREIQLEV
ncbi:Aquaporin [Erysiphe necator]|uniref:Putative water channel n=1 Tax=Uncinula necator TaxID=52586 RepID=A0A0B1P946_UNCNE|nr:Aquaporin [Erysiphe necator]KHJ35217.1 putative water channel [Erysiphe necator]